MQRQPLEKAPNQPALDRVLLFGNEHFAHRDAERGCDPPQQNDGDVAVAGFELAQIAFRNLRLTGKQLSRHTASLSQFAYASAEHREEAGVVGRHFLRGLDDAVNRGVGAHVVRADQEQTT